MVLGLVVPAFCGAGWAVVVSRRAPEGALGEAARGLAGGVAAFAAAWGGYALLDHLGIHVTWSALTSGGAGAALAAGAVGLVEEGAKLLGLWLAALGARGGGGAAWRRLLLVCAAFASLECAHALAGAPAPVLVLRALLGPVAHAALAVPLGAALAGGARGRGWVGPALLASAALHGGADLALALPAVGRLGYAAALAAPVVALHLAGRRGWAVGTSREAVP